MMHAINMAGNVCNVCLSHSRLSDSLLSVCVLLTLNRATRRDAFIVLAIHLCICQLLLSVFVSVLLAAALMTYAEMWLVLCHCIVRIMSVSLRGIVLFSQFDFNMRCFVRVCVCVCVYIFALALACKPLLLFLLLLRALFVLALHPYHCTNRIFAKSASTSDDADDADTFTFNNRKFVQHKLFAKLK